MKTNFEQLLERMSYDTKFRVLEMGTDDAELEKIAKKRGIVLPARDLSVFQGIFAFIDRTNKNGCNLPREEIEKSMKTIVGKAINFDHMRTNVVGHWIDFELIDDEIHTYGIFFKGNFEEDYELVKKLLVAGKLGISFEAYGDRSFNDDGTYDLLNIEFAGGALLIRENPAAPGAKVLDMAKKYPRVLEFASIMKAPNDFFHAKDNSTGKEKIVFSAESQKVNDNKNHFPINDGNQAKNALIRVAQYDSVPKWYDGSLSEVVEKVKRAVKLEYPSIDVANVREVPTYIYDFKNLVKDVSTAIKKQNDKKDNSNIEETKREVDRMKELLEKLLKASDDEKASVMEEIAKMFVELDKKIGKKDEEITTLKGEVDKKDDADEKKVKATKKLEDEAKSKTEQISSLETELKKAKEGLESVKTEIEAKVKDATEKASKISERRTQLGEEIAKDINDGDILNDDKFELALSKMELARVKALAEDNGLDIGGKTKKKNDDDIPKNKNLAFGKIVAKEAWTDK